MDVFVRQYLETALWSSTDGDGEPLDGLYNIDDLSPNVIKQAEADCKDFREANAADLSHAGDDSQNGHDFWLTRNRHGAGFWDRGYGDVGQRLTEAAHVYGEVDLYIGDDGVIYGT